MVKNGCQGVGRHTCRAYPPTVQEFGQIYTGNNINLGKESLVNHFMKMASDHHLPSTPMQRDKKHHKEEGRKRTTSSEDSRKEEDCSHLVKAVCGKKGVVSMTLAANMNVVGPLSAGL